jgi:hypothetical protein
MIQLDETLWVEYFGTGDREGDEGRQVNEGR